MRILGVDPGLATTGWAIVDFESQQDLNVVDFGVITTEKGLDVQERLGEIYTDLNEIINRFNPERMAVELLLFNNNAKTAMVVGEARGVILLCANQNSLPLSQFTPPQVKSSITGSGRADKRQVQENILRLCHLDELPRPDDAADAIAIAVCCYDSLKTARIEVE